MINAYSGHAIDSCEVHQTVKTTPYIRAEANYNSSRKLTWTPEAVSGKTDVFYLRASAFRAAYMDVKSASAASGTELQLHAGNQSNAQRFKLVKQDDGSFVAYTEASGFKMCLDGQFGDKEIKDRRVLKQSACNNNSPAESQNGIFILMNKRMNTPYPLKRNIRKAKTSLPKQRMKGITKPYIPMMK